MRWRRNSTCSTTRPSSIGKRICILHRNRDPHSNIQLYLERGGLLHLPGRRVQEPRFRFFRRLNRSVAKRLYRFLDKRFFHRPRWEFHLQELCWEHVGLARSHDAANLRRKLRPAIEELERHQFIRPASDAERFRKVCSGKWRVFFERAGRGAAKVAAPPSNTDALCQALSISCATSLLAMTQKR